MRKILLFISVLLTIGWGGIALAQVCDNDGICEPLWLGENCEHCADCIIDPPFLECEYCDLSTNLFHLVPANKDSRECAKPFALSSDGTRDPNSGETCFHSDCSCTFPYICEVDPLLLAFPFVSCFPPCDNDGICEAIDNEDCHYCPNDCLSENEVCVLIGGLWVSRIASVPGNAQCEDDATIYFPTENCSTVPFDCVCDCGFLCCKPSDPAADPNTGCLTVPPPVPTSFFQNLLSAGNFEDLIGDIINTIFYFAVILAPLLFIIAGFYFITAGENVARVNTAKTIATWTAIGLFIILAAKGIVLAIKTMMGA